MDLESEATRGPGSIPIGGDILSLEYFLFSRSKEKNTILAFSYSLQKTRLGEGARITLDLSLHLALVYAPLVSLKYHFLSLKKTIVFFLFWF